jgi:hypothetical protein
MDGASSNDNPDRPLRYLQKTFQVTMIHPGEGKVVSGNLTIQPMDAAGDQAFMCGVADPPGKNALPMFPGGTGKLEGITGVYRTADAGTTWPDGSLHFHVEIDREIPDR